MSYYWLSKTRQTLINSRSKLYTMTLSFQRLFFAVASIFALFAIMILAKTILIPLSIALLISFILLPVVKKLEKWGVNKSLSVTFSILGVFIIIGGILLLFSTQFIKLSSKFTDFKEKILTAFTDLTLYINEHVSFLPDLEKEDLINKIKTWVSESSGTLISKSISGTSAFFAGFIISIIFTFLFLIYRKGLTNAFASFAKVENRPRVVKMLKSVQQVGQKYIIGMFILINLVGLINSIGLWIIGLDSPFFFGFLGATFSILPYIGTTIGTIIPAVFALVSYDTILIAVGVVILFWAVQLITDNFLTPKIVGTSLNVNALASILSIIVGASVWGAAGMILFLPFAAMLKVVCEEFDELKPVALLIGTKSYIDGSGKNKSVGMIKKVWSWIKKVWGWIKGKFGKKLD